MSKLVDDCYEVDRYLDEIAKELNIPIYRDYWALFSSRSSRLKIIKDRIKELKNGLKQHSVKEYEG